METTGSIQLNGGIGINKNFIVGEELVYFDEDGMLVSRRAHIQKKWDKRKLKRKLKAWKNL